MDLDGFTDICRVHGWPCGDDRDALSGSGMGNALEFFSRERIPATLFAIAQDVHDAAKRRRLHEAVTQGHEIASHSVTHRTLTRLSAEEKRREIVDSRATLQDALSVPVRGFRAPGFAVDAESLHFVEEAGYDYDSSLFPGRSGAKRVGLATIPVAPHHPLRGTGRLRELPMPPRASLPFPFHPSYSLVMGNWYFELGLRRVRPNAAPLVLLFHLTDFADPLPAYQLHGWKARLYTLSSISAADKLDRCRRMLEAVRKRYRIVSTAELLRDWTTSASSQGT
jgi:hypothetical protein